MKDTTKTVLSVALNTVTLVASAYVAKQAWKDVDRAAEAIGKGVANLIHKK